MSFDGGSVVRASAPGDVPADAPGVTRPHYTHRQILEILSGLMMAMLTAMISTSVVGTALPTIVGDLGGQDQLSWVASASLLTMTASTPLWGKLSDIFGRKLMFQGALLLFVVASVAAGLSQNIGELIAARAFQGLGVGGLSALAQVILGDVVEPRQRGRYSGFMGAVFGVATVAGPLLGGFIVDADGLGWRWCFYVCVPLAVVAFAVIQKVLKLPKVRRDTRIDVFGAFTITGGATTAMLLLSMGGQQFAWNSRWTYLLLGATGVLLVLAAVAERTARDPILPPRLFRNRTFVIAGLTSVCVGIAMFGAMIYMPQYLQIVKGMSPTSSGLMTLPLVVGMLVTSTGSGQLVTRTGRYKIFPVLGLVFVGASMLLLSRLHVGSSKLLIGADMAVLGIGLGLTLQILILAAQNAAAPADLASTTSGVSFFRNLGGAMGVAAFGAILTNRLGDELAAGVREAHISLPPGGGELGSPHQIQALPEPLKHIVLTAFTDALESVFLVGVPVAVLGFLAVLALKEVPLRGSAGRGAPAKDAPPSDAGVGVAGGHARGHDQRPAAGREPASVVVGAPSDEVVGAMNEAAMNGTPPNGASPQGRFGHPEHTSRSGHSGAGVERSETADAPVARVDRPSTDRPSTGRPHPVGGRGGVPVRGVVRSGTGEPVPSAALRGTVRGETGRPVADARVTLVDAAGDAIAMVITGPDGEYAFTDLVGGRYTIIASGYPPVATGLSLSGGGEDGHDIELGHPDR
ncbi:MFS transporter [Actinomadura graeca]|uniref:MFS transporter n=1 Tax=Actinomadura graeca TaxID=2750812 RepID=A0ABX8QXY3_9ACTN|nr:MFS transporter [Actinomadura graeca]